MTAKSAIIEETGAIPESKVLQAAILKHQMSDSGDLGTGINYHS